MRLSEITITLDSDHYKNVPFDRIMAYQLLPLDIILKADLIILKKCSGEKRILKDKFRTYANRP